MMAIVAPSIGQRLSEPAGTPRIAVAGPHADPGPVVSLPPPPTRPVIRVAAPPARTSGEDGLMGSLVLDLEPSYAFVLWWPGGKLGGMTSLAKS
jgi:hypothetical protein